MNTMENNKNGINCECVNAEKSVNAEESVNAGNAAKAAKAKHASTSHLKKRPSALLSFTPIALLVIMLVATIRAFGSDSLAGASQVTLIAVSAFCVLIGMGYLNVPWSSFEKAITKNVSSVSSALIILLLIGALGGAWMVSGVVPTLIYYGMHIIHPSVFLASTCLICALVSLMTGSSWTTIATIGIALMGIGRAQGFADGWVAGAIISGAYFGDKISPLSETTTLASGSLGVQLFSHIRYMLLTTVPSITLALIIFAVAGLTIDTTETQEVASFMAALDGRFNITPWLLIVPVATGVLIARKTPPIVTIFLSTLLAVACGLIFQREALAEIDPSMFKAAMMSVYGETTLSTSNQMLTELVSTLIFQREALAEIDPSMFKAAMMSVYGETTLSTSNQMLTELVSTRGMAGMTDTIWLIICAMCFGGTMAASGMVGGITRLFIHMVKGRTSLVASTATTGVMLNVAIADQYLCILLTGNMFRDVYDRENYERRLLSRTTEDAVTVTSVLVPWNTCGMTQSTVLGVATTTYLPYCFFNIISPIMSVVVAAIGYKIFRKGEAQKELPQCGNTVTAAW